MRSRLFLLACFTLAFTGCDDPTVDPYRSDAGGSNTLVGPPAEGGASSSDGGPSQNDAAGGREASVPDAAVRPAADGGVDAEVTADAGPEACAHCTGPGDWGPGDYPPELREHVYLTIEGVPGQGDAVRGYKVHVPPDYDPDVPMPVLFAMHGLGQNPLLYALDGAGWPEKSDAEGFILVMPNGNARAADGSWSLLGSWNAGECCGGAAQSGVDDVALIRAIADEVGSHLNLDLTRVYATGMSNGGFLSYRLACEAADLFVAIAPGAGAIGSPELAPMGVGNADFTVCEPSHPVSVLAMHGTADLLVPYDYFEPSLSHMAEQNGCAATTVPAKVPESGGDTACITHEDCPDGVQVTGCTVEAGGHCWFGNESCGTGAPGIGNAIVGADSDFFVSTDAAWEFLSQQRRVD